LEVLARIVVRKVDARVQLIIWHHEPDDCLVQLFASLAVRWLKCFVLFHVRQAPVKLFYPLGHFDLSFGFCECLRGFWATDTDKV